MNPRHSHSAADAPHAPPWAELFAESTDAMLRLQVLLACGDFAAVANLCQQLAASLLEAQAQMFDGALRLVESDTAMEAVTALDPRH